MYKVSRDCEYHRINNDGMIDIVEDDEREIKIIAFFTSLYDAMHYCESKIQTIELDLGESTNIYIYNIDKILIDENGAFTKIDEKFNCKYYADNIKYIGDNDETFEYIET